ncbi:HEAT repeat-containing protein [Actinidia rufa]|uniref:HEAT repeat-containing protein n=1 Tax=Actinidia rufa TaxID=165716 RepID=A0A7J0EBB2_9ERIC|nr:HEAT repeat-containing protein [Actinidia rufa]
MHLIQVALRSHLFIKSLKQLLTCFQKSLPSSIYHGFVEVILYSNVGDLSIEASQNLGLLLDELRLPTVKSLSNSMMIVLINSLSAIAKKRPAFLRSHSASLTRPSSACLQCTRTSAAPWRDCLVDALSEIKGEGLVEQTLHQVCQINGSVEREDDIPTQVACDMADDDVSGKRLRSTPTVSEGSEQDLSRDKVTVPSSGQSSSRGDGDNGLVQQLVAMFGGLVARAEVVMANMRNLPPNRPKAEGDEEPLLNRGSSPNIVGRDAQFKHLSSILTQLLSVSIAPTHMDFLLDAQLSSSNDIENPQGDKELALVAVADNDVICIGVRYESEQALVPLPVCSSDEVQSAKETGFSALPSGFLDVGSLESGIPGLSEELSPKAAITDASSIKSSTATSVGLFAQFVLPKMSAPVMNLADEEKDTLQKLTFTCIVEAYKQIAIAGGTRVHIACPLQAETLRDSFPASGKSLSRLLGEAPYLPKSIFKLLESLCSPCGNDKDDKELHSGD